MANNLRYSASREGSFRHAHEAAALLKGVYIGMADEGDHTLSPFWIPAMIGDRVPKRLTVSTI